jgi:alpha-beta hydrolase superfamily lysophospholipase
MFAWVHTPASEMVRGAVVLCQPFGQEYKNSRSSFQKLADQLAAHGFAALRYDHPGTGDSTGKPPEGEWVAAWSAGLEAAVRLAREWAGPAVTIVGMRLGATIAAAEASRLGGLSGLVLWDPCQSGRSFLRQQLLLASAADLSDSGTATVQAPGFHLPEELNYALPWPSEPLREVDRTLIMLAPGRKDPPGLRKWLGASPADYIEATGQAELLEGELPGQVVPNQAIASIVRWIDKLPGGTLSEVRLPDVRRIHLSNDLGDQITEELVEFGRGLFGIRTDPISSAKGPALIFCNPANDHRIGPGRLWVDLARHLATLGFPVLRFDLSGIGDSPARDGEPEQRICSPTAFDDNWEAMKLISPSDPRRVVFVGLCTGAYQSLETAMQYGIVGVCAINPVLAFQPPEVDDGRPMDPRRKFCLAPSPLESVARNRQILVALKNRYPNISRRLRHRLSVGDAPSRFRELVELGVDTLIVSGRPEAIAFRQNGRRLLAALERTGLYHLEVLSDLDHSLLTELARRQVAECVEEFMIKHQVADYN